MGCRYYAIWKRSSPSSTTTRSAPPTASTYRRNASICTRSRSPCSMLDTRFSPTRSARPAASVSSPPTAQHLKPIRPHPLDHASLVRLDCAAIDRTLGEHLLETLCHRVHLPFNWSRWAAKQSSAIGMLTLYQVFHTRRSEEDPGLGDRAGVTRSPPVAASPPSSKPSRTPTGPPPLHLWRVSHVGIPPGRPLLTRLTVARIPRVPHQKSRCERPLAERRYDVTVTPTRVRPTVRSVPGRRG